MVSPHTSVKRGERRRFGPGPSIGYCSEKTELLKSSLSIIKMRNPPEGRKGRKPE